MKLRAAIAAAAAVPLAFGLTACGGSQPTGYKPSAPSFTPVGPISSAAPRQVARGTQLDTASFMPAMKKGMVGKNTARLTMRLVAGRQTTTMAGVLSVDPPAALLDLSGAEFGGRTKLILVDDVVYLSTPELPAGKYVEIDANSDDPLAQSVGEVLESMDPTKIYDAFDAGLRNAEYITTETLGGRKVDRYAVTVDVAAALKAQGEQVPAGMPKDLVYTIWMGSTDHLMYKVSFDMQGVSAEMTATDWGKPVTVEPPAASDIVRR
jgi:hypothetical protein